MVTLRPNCLVYAQGAPDAGIVAREIDDMSRRLTGGLHLKIAYDNETSWPFVWYLRNYDNAVYFGEAPSGPLDADVVLVGTANEAATTPFIGDGYVRRETPVDLVAVPGLVHEDDACLTLGGPHHARGPKGDSGTSSSIASGTNL